LHSDDAHGSGPGIEVTAIDSVAIVDQMGRLMGPKASLRSAAARPMQRWIVRARRSGLGRDGKEAG
jgi:hypothetical protein